MREFDWVRLWILIAVLSVGMAVYMFAVDFIARWIPDAIAFLLPEVLVWLTVFTFIRRGRNADESVAVFRTRLAVIPVIAVPIVSVVGFSIAMLIGGLWVQMTWKMPPRIDAPAKSDTRSP
jgi:hypothetical protein